jgi:glycosyltransferase involved in cell wall biosynthesis
MQRDKKNLIELCLSPDLGGLELYMMRCAKALAEEFNVISVISPKGKLEQYFRGTEHAYRTVEKKSNLLMFGAAHRVAKIIDENGIDIVHLHWTKDIPIAVLAKQLSKRKPRLVQTRNMTMTRFKDDFYHRFLYKNIDLMLPVTKQVAAQLERFIPESVRPRIEVLYMGTDEVELLDVATLSQLRQELGMAESFAVGLVGRIEETKGQHLLIEALALLRQKEIDVQAFFVGHEMEKGYIDKLNAKAEALGVASSVHFLGFMKNPSHFMQACDAMVLATPCETFGLVVIEAMAAGTPVIATDRCGPLEIIEDGVNGLLFEKESAASLSRQIETLCRHADQCATLGEAGQKRVREAFANRVQFQKLAKLLDAV